MRVRTARGGWVFVLLALGCKDPERVDEQERTRTYQARLQQGRQQLAAGMPTQAAAAFQEASNLAPLEQEPLLLLAEAHLAVGNEGPAVLALKQASSLKGSGPEAAAISKKLAAYYQRTGRIEQALSTLIALRDEGHLTDEEVLALARLQAHRGLFDAAFQTLEVIQRQRPEDVEAKVMEAEILLLKGEELLAANLMDRLLNQNPNLLAARLLRVRYFLHSGYGDMAEKDLEAVTGADASRPEVLQLRAQARNAQGKHAEAEALLNEMLKAQPDDAEALALLAETKQLQGQLEQALSLVDKALEAQAGLPRAFYVRARVLEQKGRLPEAMEGYRDALGSNPYFVPALQRIWPLHQNAQNDNQAIAALERLLSLGEAGLEEKAALAGLYAKTHSQVERGRQLIAEVLRAEPDNEQYLSIQKQLTPPAPKRKKSGPLILRGGR